MCPEGEEKRNWRSTEDVNEGDGGDVVREVREGEVAVGDRGDGDGGALG